MYGKAGNVFYWNQLKVHFILQESSIQLELLPPFPCLFPFRLARFFKQAIVDHQPIHIGSHKTLIGILRRTDDRFSPHIKAGIDHKTASCLSLECVDQIPIPFIGLFMNGLNPGGKIHVGHGRNIRSQPIESVPDIRGVVRQSGFSVSISYRRHQKHVGRCGFDIKIFPGIFRKNRWRKRPETLPKFYFKVQPLLHFRISGVSQNTAVSQGPRPPFHPSLKPPDDVSFRQQSGRIRAQ